MAKDLEPSDLMNRVNGAVVYDCMDAAVRRFAGRATQESKPSEGARSYLGGPAYRRSVCLA